jgi:acyl carrier protein
MTASTGFDFILDYLESRYRKVQNAEPGGLMSALTRDRDLIESRILDSLGFVEFILLVEEHSGREISIDSVSKEDFRTINSIRKRFFDGA